MIQVGALDALGVSRLELLWRLQVASTPRAQKAAARSAVASRGALFARGDEVHSHERGAQHLHL